MSDPPLAVGVTRGRASQRVVAGVVIPRCAFGAPGVPVVALAILRVPPAHCSVFGRFCLAPAGLAPL
eukprot:3847980-Alexandrium_andersonii.AAC.1